MIADEVMTGFCRTGKWFAMEHWGVVPDMITVSKGINGGALPLGAVLLRGKIAERFDKTFVPIGSTQTGNPVSCAAGVAALQVYQDFGLADHATRMGELLMGYLSELKERHPCIGDVRGLGLLTTIELVTDRATKAPLIRWNTSPAFSDRIRRMLLSRGLHVTVRWNLILVAPPLIITPEQIAEGVAILDEVLAEIDATV
jgi:taurine--2-oxoglutarate transaminase